jgi:hypothetical protein
MDSYKLHNVAKVIEQIALSGLDFLNAANSPEVMGQTQTILKSDLYLSQARVASMITQKLMEAMKADEAALVSSN